MGGEEIEVAVKSLADGSTEERRVQFLQEAAIMSQFKNPNVITLHGVVLEDKQVSLEMIFLMFVCIYTSLGNDFSRNHECWRPTGTSQFV